ncbi:hypothetical protein GGR52DRAFT_58185 [Hypoxylon sp. FL1284]|nr:hypothetical protein GGR52DRAFT_58185 [Hypoxylon sp. FL1284]
MSATPPDKRTLLRFRDNQGPQRQLTMRFRYSIGRRVSRCVPYVPPHATKRVSLTLSGVLIGLLLIAVRLEARGFSYESLQTRASSQLPAHSHTTSTVPRVASQPSMHYVLTTCKLHMESGTGIRRAWDIQHRVTVDASVLVVSQRRLLLRCCCRQSGLRAVNKTAASS